MEPIAGPSSMAMGNQPMPSRYPLHKRLSEGGVQGFLLSLWSDKEISFFSKHINLILVWCTTQLDCPQTINSPFPRAPLCGSNYPPSPPLSRRHAFGWLLRDFHLSAVSKARTNFCCHFFSSTICNSKQRDNTPPHIPPRSPFLFNAPSTVNANFWLVVVSPHQTVAI